MQLSAQLVNPRHKEEFCVKANLPEQVRAIACAANSLFLPEVVLPEDPPFSIGFHKGESSSVQNDLNPSKGILSLLRQNLNNYIQLQQ